MSSHLFRGEAAAADAGAQPAPAFRFEDAPVGLAVLDHTGAIADINPAFLDILGSGRDAMLGQPLAACIARHARDGVDRRLAKLVLGTARSAQLGLVALASGKRQSEVLLAAARLEHDGELCGLILSVQPVVPPPAIDAALAQAQKLQAVGQLAGGVAHDFNNLLTAITGFTDLLLARHGDGDPSHDDIVQIRGAATRAAGLVRQLLAFSRQQAANPAIVDPAAAIAHLSLMLTRLLGPAIELRLEAGDAPLRVFIDSVQFDQVILNLAVNARDAMPGGGRLTIRSEPHSAGTPTAMSGEVMPPGSYVRIAVSDTGVGIPEDILGNIFEPFFTTKGAGAGTGLGLSTVYGIVRQAGGFIAVDSAPGCGATFAVYLPRAVGQVMAATGRPAEPAPAKGIAGFPAPSTGGRGTILLVEDETGVRAFAAKVLRRAGYRVLVAADGEAALALLDAEGAGIDAAITDVMMPGMDGHVLARLLAERLGDVPVILMSGCADDTIFGAEAGGLAHVLMKPFTLPELTAKVAAVLAAKCGGTASA